jgi:Zn-finger nucleic acid-binding protein
MKCPNDQTTLVISERQSIEIDYCPECRGVWLDRGELDKLIERSQQILPAQPPVPDRGAYPTEQKYPAHSSDERYYKKKKKESFLGDIFDF